MIRRTVAALVVCAAFALPLHADFASVARAIDAQKGVRRNWIPFLGIARFAVRMIEPAGVHDFQLATFRGAAGLDPRVLHDIIRKKAGNGFTPLVQVWSRKSKEWSFIYARPAAGSDQMELLVLAHDGEETVLVRVNADAELVAREIQHSPRDVSQVARR